MLLYFIAHFSFYIGRSIKSCSDVSQYYSSVWQRKHIPAEHFIARLSFYIGHLTILLKVAVMCLSIIIQCGNVSIN